MRDGLIYSRNLSTIDVALKTGLTKVSDSLNKFDLEQIKKISSLLGLTEVKIVASKKKVSVILGSTDVKSSNNFCFKI